MSDIILTEKEKQWVRSQTLIYEKEKKIEDLRIKLQTESSENKQKVIKTEINTIIQEKQDEIDALNEK